MSEDSLPRTPHIARDQQPPLGIGHLMLWTIGSAILLAIHRHLDPPQTERSLGPLSLETLQQLLTCLSYGITVGTVILFCYRKITRGPRFPVQPGHWYLLISGLAIITSWVVRGVIRLLEFAIPEMAVLTVNNVPAMMTLIFWGGASLVAVIALKDSSCWRWLFGWEALTHMVSGVALFFPGGAFLLLGTICGGIAISAAWAVVAMILDVGAGRKRDWLHWVGAVLIPLTAAMYFLFLVTSLVIA